MSFPHKSRDVRWNTPFGPIIMHSTISDDLHNILLNRADQLRNGTHPNKKINTKTNDYRNRLAGCLSEEYSYQGAFSKEEVEQLLEKTGLLFVEHAPNFEVRSFVTVAQKS